MSATKTETILQSDEKRPPTFSDLDGTPTTTHEDPSVYERPAVYTLPDAVQMSVSSMAVARRPAHGPSAYMLTSQDSNLTAGTRRVSVPVSPSHSFQQHHHHQQHQQHHHHQRHQQPHHHRRGQVEQAGPKEGGVRIVEVPVIEEHVITVAKKQYVEIERHVPRRTVQYVDKLVEVPHVQYVIKEVDVPVIQDVVTYVPVREVVEVQKEVVRYVPKIDVKTVEREVEVPGEVIEVPKPYLVENRVIKAKYIKKEVPAVVSQLFRPVVTECEDEVVEVEMRMYQPTVVPIDIYIPRPVERTATIKQMWTEHHVVTDYPQDAWSGREFPLAFLPEPNQVGHLYQPTKK